MRTANPALNDKAFQNFPASLSSEPMTVQGTVNKTFLALFILLGTAAWTWGQAFSGGNVQALIGVSAIAGFIVGLVTIFKKSWAPVTTPIYSAVQGLVIGSISAYFEMRFPGIVIQAVTLTFGTLFALLLAYQSRLIRVDQNFRLGLVAATGGIMVVYVVDLIMSLFGHRIPFIHESGLFGILFSLFVVVIAALNLVLDFDFIEQGAAAGAPKYMEWYGAFGLMVTLIWLYMEILRLLAKTRRRD